MSFGIIEKILDKEDSNKKRINKEINSLNREIRTHKRNSSPIFNETNSYPMTDYEEIKITSSVSASLLQTKDLMSIYQNDEDETIGLLESTRPN